MGLELANTLISLAIGGITLATLLFGFAVTFRKRLRAFQQRARDVIASAEQLPELLTSHNIMKEQLGAVTAMAQRVQAAVLPNGGGSIPDKLVDISKQVTDNNTHLGSLGKKVDAITNTSRARANADTRLSTFDTDEFGRCTYANRTYLRWTGLSLADIVGWGWLNTVHPDDRAAVREEWNAAVRESRRFHGRYRMLDPAGTAFAVESSAEPIPEGSIPSERWVGSIFRISG